MVQRDFGLVGTVVGETRDPHKIRVVLKGSKLGVPLDAWIQKNEVFAVVQVNRLGGSHPVRDALLQVIEPPDKEAMASAGCTPDMPIPTSHPGLARVPASSATAASSWARRTRRYGSGW